MRVVVVNDKIQSNYQYVCTEPVGKNFSPLFKPELTPREMLELGVFGGKYLTDCREEFPSDWFTHAKLSPEKKDPSVNYFKVNASQPLAVWIAKGWIYKDDPRGWFQWYCRYFMGRRLPVEDDRQIARWRSMKRHIIQLKNSCKKGDISCHPKQRQALLHWAYDSRVM